jgi:hypothetical protein
MKNLNRIFEEVLRESEYENGYKFNKKDIVISKITGKTGVICGYQTDGSGEKSYYINFSGKPCNMYHNGYKLINVHENDLELKI